MKYIVNVCMDAPMMKEQYTTEDINEAFLLYTNIPLSEKQKWGPGIVVQSDGKEYSLLEEEKVINIAMYPPLIRDNSQILFAYKSLVVLSLNDQIVIQEKSIQSEIIKKCVSLLEHEFSDDFVKKYSSYVIADQTILNIPLDFEKGEQELIEDIKVALGIRDFHEILNEKAMFLCCSKEKEELLNILLLDSEGKALGNYQCSRTTPLLNVYDELSGKVSRRHFFMLNEDKRLLQQEFYDNGISTDEAAVFFEGYVDFMGSYCRTFGYTGTFIGLCKDYNVSMGTTNVYCNARALKKISDQVRMRNSFAQGFLFDHMEFYMDRLNAVVFKDGKKKRLPVYRNENILYYSVDGEIHCLTKEEIESLKKLKTSSLSLQEKLEQASDNAVVINDARKKYGMGN